VPQESQKSNLLISTGFSIVNFLPVLALLYIKLYKIVDFPSPQDLFVSPYVIRAKNAPFLCSQQGKGEYKPSQERDLILLITR